MYLWSPIVRDIIPPPRATSPATQAKATLDPPPNGSGNLRILTLAIPKRPLERAIRALGIKSPRSPPLNNIEIILTRGQTRPEVSFKARLEPTLCCKDRRFNPEISGPTKFLDPSVAENTRPKLNPDPKRGTIVRVAFHCIIGPKIMSYGRGAALHRSAHPIWTHMIPLRCTYGPPSYVTIK